MSSRRDNRSYSQPTSPKPQKTEKIPLPISKNVVLITLMEAGLNKEQDCNDEESLEDTEVERILDAMESPTFSCGTYLVTEDSGLVVLASDPRMTNSDNSNSSFNCQKKNQEIEKGNTVQIVEVNDNIYKLARNAGFIVANDKQLEKVMGPHDDSCRLEGMSKIVRDRTADLKKRSAELNRISNGLATQIQDLQSKKPSYPIIAAESESRIRDEEKENEGMNQGSGQVQFVSNAEEEEKQTTTTPVTRASLTPHLPPDSKVQPKSPNCVSFVDNNPVFCERGVKNSLSCASFPSSAELCDHEDRRHLLYRTNTFDDRLLLSAQSTTGNCLNSPSKHGSIDFSTGLSGHGALSGTKAGRSQVRRKIRMMGEHRGANLFSAFSGKKQP
eukprot:CAMPEP_0194208426 /NCGR_PEP_ID=MMETSP0156-20130528/6879_1 /TAXON_ID=33649 /ORGANISM="Thalassionema nitzschioides, Strain L26-B" /LENGTH=385 /DNA_ID=CAMNT_0038935387 /DNA_START=238 /DNA_END=1395 /DNA_ORIENTATION=-